MIDEMQNQRGEPSRPDPDRLLEKIKSEDKNGGRGQLKIFFGYAAGVGKTYAMLEAAHDVKKTGTDVVVGYIEPHTRPETLALLPGLEVLDARHVVYRGIRLREFDLDGALRRRPQLILVDELAHTNAEGQRHRKRWQDIGELLQAGIDVYTTVNVQHLESLNDVVASITKTFVRETVPDRIFDEAENVELIDIEPEELLNRLNEGKVYKKDQARQAMHHFFSKENLDALREVALRRMADRVNREVETARLAKGQVTVIPTAEHLLACVSHSPYSARVIRAAARMAETYHTGWIAFYVETADFQRLNTTARDRLRANLNMAEQLGAEIITVHGEDVAGQIIRYANLRNITKIVVGRDQKSSLKYLKFYARDIVDKIMNSGSNFDVYVIPGRPQDNKKAAKSHFAKPRQAFKVSWPDAAKTLGIMGAATLLGALFQHISFPATNIIMIYILGVLIVSITTRGYLMGVAASIMGVVFSNYLFIEPRFTLSVYDTRYLFTFPVMLIVALITSTLTTRLQQQAERSNRREQRTGILYQTSHSLLRSTGKDSIVTLGLDHLAKLFRRGVICYLARDGHNLSAPFLYAGDGEEKIDAILDPDERAVAYWVLLNGQAAGAGTDTLPGAHAFYLPITGQKGVLGVIGISCEQGVIEPDQRSLLETVTAQIALALDREWLVEEQEYSRMEIEREKLRNNLLRAISHDLRSPLTGIAGAAGTILEKGASLEDEIKQNLLQGVYDDAEWLIRLVENLLSMTRLDEGKLEIKKTREALEEVVVESVQRMRKRAAGHVIKIKIPDKLIMVPMDGKLIEQVLINLIDNAVKYTPKGSVIEIKAYERPPGIVIEVADNGPGIPGEAFAHLFDRFFTTENKLTDARRGIGLGLAICKSIVTAHGGTIEATNGEKGGAVFRFTLPY